MGQVHTRIPALKATWHDGRLRGKRLRQHLVVLFYHRLNHGIFLALVYVQSFYVSYIIDKPLCVNFEILVGFLELALKKLRLKV